MVYGKWKSNRGFGWNSIEWSRSRSELCFIPSQWRPLFDSPEDASSTNEFFTTSRRNPSSFIQWYSIQYSFLFIYFKLIDNYFYSLRKSRICASNSIPTSRQSSNGRNSIIQDFNFTKFVPLLTSLIRKLRKNFNYIQLYIIRFIYIE